MCGSSRVVDEKRSETNVCCFYSANGLAKNERARANYALPVTNIVVSVLTIAVVLATSHT
jgi:hypothetical protein